MCLWAASGLTINGSKRVALALEWLHTASLIQDDLPVMDDERVRRGEPTVHRVHGEGIALLASDAFVMLAFEELTALESLIGAQKTIQTISAATKAIGADGLVGGQSRDLQHRERAIVTTDDLLAVHDRKTAPLFRLIATCFGITTELPAAQLESLEQAFAGLGIAFQIVDDLLDGSEQKSDEDSSDQRNVQPSFATIMSRERALNLANSYIKPFTNLVATDPQLKPISALASFVVARKH
jgi:geranylgeranyl pyrophosphate synthase